MANKKYPDELRARAVRLYRDADPKPVIKRLGEQLGVHPEALRNWIRQDEADRGVRADLPTTEMLEENRRLRKENALCRTRHKAFYADGRVMPRPCPEAGWVRGIRNGNAA